MTTPQNARNISYQSIGMVAENINISNCVMDVALAPALEMLDEVVVGGSYAYAEDRRGTGVFVWEPQGTRGPACSSSV